MTSTAPRTSTTCAVDAALGEVAPAVTRGNEVAIRAPGELAARRRCRRRAGRPGRASRRRSRAAGWCAARRRAPPRGPRRSGPARPAHRRRTRRCPRCGRTAARGRRWRRSALRRRSDSSKSSPADRSRSTDGSASRPLFGSARRSRAGHRARPRAAARRSRSRTQPIPVAAVAQPLVDAADRGARGAGALADLVVAHALVEQARHLPARRELAQLVHRAQVAQEAERLVAVAQRRRRPRPGRAWRRSSSGPR